jgi:hypothetical protein
MLPTKFRFIWPSGFRGEDLKKLANKKQELPVVAMFVNGSGQNVHIQHVRYHTKFISLWKFTMFFYYEIMPSTKIQN